MDNFVELLIDIPAYGTDEALLCHSGVVHGGFGISDIHILYVEASALIFLGPEQHEMLNCGKKEGSSALSLCDLYCCLKVLLVLLVCVDYKGGSLQ